MMTLTAAYNRNYTSKKAVLADFDGGKDFVINDITSRYDGKYTSVRDIADGERVAFRYNFNRKVFYHTVVKEEK